MPMTYRYDHEAGVLFVACAGEVTQAERLEAMRAWQSDPGYRPGIKTLCDFTLGTSTPSFAELKKIATLLTAQPDLIGRKELAVITARPVTFGAARQFQALLDSTTVEMKVFHDREAAWTWLEIGKPLFLGSLT
jgi:hypothetical protein